MLIFLLKRKIPPDCFGHEAFLWSPWVQFGILVCKAFRQSYWCNLRSAQWQTHVALSGCFVESSRVPYPWFLATFLFSCLLQKWSLALWNDSARPASCPATFALFKALCPPALTPKASTFDPKMYLGDVMLPGMLPLWSDALKGILIWKHFEIQEGETCGITETSVLRPSATSSSSILLGRRLKLMSASFAK